MTAEELLERYAAGERDFRGVELRLAKLQRFNLSGVILDGADLTHTRLVGTVLEDSSLQGVSLCDSDLTRANFRNANLTKADVTDSIIIGTDFVKATLVKTKMLGSGIKRVSFGRADMQQVDLSQCCLTCCSFFKTDLRRACLHETRFKICDLSFANFKGARRRKGWDWYFGDCYFRETVMPDGTIADEDLIDINDDDDLI